MSGDEDERAIETQRLVQELAEVRKRMQMRAEQPPLRSGNSGAYRAVTPLPFLAAKAIAETRARTSPPPAEGDAGEPPNAREAAKDEDEPPPPTRRRPA